MMALKKNTLLIVGFLILGCSNEIQDFNQLQNRDGIYYQINAEEPYTGKVESHYPSGILALDGSLEKGYKVGLWTTYYENTQKKSQGTYVTNLKDGTWTYWEKNGKVMGTENYKNGTLLSKQVEQNSSGSEVESGVNHQTDMDGDGKTDMQSTINQNEKSSVNSSEKGNENPTKIVSVHELRTKLIRGKMRKTYNGNVYTGSVIDYDANGIKSMTGYYKDGSRSGKWTYYYPNGDVKNEKYW